MTVRAEDVAELLAKKPFQPFRITLSNGDSHVVRHPEMAMVSRTTLHLGIPEPHSLIPDRITSVELLHVVEMTPLAESGTS